MYVCLVYLFFFLGGGSGGNIESLIKLNEPINSEMLKNFAAIEMVLHGLF